MADTAASQPATNADAGEPTMNIEGVDAHPLGPLEKALQDTAETLDTLAVGVRDFTYEAQAGLFTAVNQLVQDLSGLDAAAAGVDAQIPIDVLEAIDRGRNPEQCTYQMLEACAEASAAARGKMDCMATFRAALDRAVLEGGSALPTAEDVANAQRPREYLEEADTVLAEGGVAELGVSPPAGQEVASSAQQGEFLDPLNTATAGAGDLMKNSDIFAMPS